MRALLMTQKKGWKPGSNTVAYYPLTSVTTTNDMSGNNKNLSSITGTVNYGLYQGVNCGYFVSGAGLTNGALSFGNHITVNCWIYMENTSAYNQIPIVIGPQANTSPGTNVLSFWQNSNDQRCSLSSFSASYEIYINGGQKFNQRFNVGFTYDNGLCKLYINSEYKGQYSHNITFGTYIDLGRRNNGDRMYGGGMSNVIVEKIVRTADDFTNYYNDTKSNYGL